MNHLTTEDIKKINDMDVDEMITYMNDNFPMSEEESKEIDQQINKLCFYKIKDIDLVGKIEHGSPYVYLNGSWKVDNDNIITDRLMGYDGDSIGSSTIFDIDEITEEEAMNLIGG